MTNNLDSLCAQHGRQIITEAGIDTNTKNKAENYLTKALGVLQEDGLYAFYLFLAYRENQTEAMAKTQVHSLQLLCNDLRLTNNEVTEDELLESGKRNAKCYDVAQELSDDLDKLLMARELIEQILIYARYHAKAI